MVRKRKNLTRRRRTRSRKSVRRLPRRIYRGGVNKEYVAEMICNVSKEGDRLEKLKPIIEVFNVTLNYTVDKTEVTSHPLYSKFNEKATPSERSLYINFIKLLEKHKEDGMYVLFLESDVKPLKDIASCKADIDRTLPDMKAHNIDMVYLCKGHIKDIGDPPETRIRNEAESTYDNLTNILGSNHGLSDIPNDTGKKITNTLYKAATSRAGEAILIGPKLIQRFIAYFYNTDNHFTADWDFNIFFNKNPDIIVAWRIPELFEQDKGFSTLLNDRK
jgi:hypothetical protein